MICLRHIGLYLAVTLGILTAGCQTPPKSARTAPKTHPRPRYTTVAQEGQRQTQIAEQKNNQALTLMQQEEWDQAAALLKEALQEDIMFGPAHNNLGKVYFAKNEYYLAAWEFQYAAKLLPHVPEPRNNLGLVFEKVGRLQEAIDWYHQAVQIEPDNAQILGNLARAKVRHGDKDDDLRRILSDLVFKDTRPDWNAWAQRQLALLGGPLPATQPQTPPLPPS